MRHFLVMTCTAALLGGMLWHAPVEARGRVGGGGFSRSGPASGGGFSSTRLDTPVVVQSTGGIRSASGVRSTVGVRSASGARQPGDVRSAGGFSQPRDASSAGGVSQPRGAQSAGGVDSDGSLARARAAAGQLSDAEMKQYREQFARDNQSVRDNAARKDWDSRPVDPDYSVPENGRPVVDHPVAAAAAAAIAIDNRTDWVGEFDHDDVVTVTDDPEPATAVPCTIQGQLVLDDVTYYRCRSGWYKRALQGDRVVYVQTPPPPGY